MTIYEKTATVEGRWHHVKTMKRLEAKLPNYPSSPFYVLKQKMLQTGNARTMAKKALEANIGNEAKEKHQAAVSISHLAQGIHIQHIRRIWRIYMYPI